MYSAELIHPSTHQPTTLQMTWMCSGTYARPVAQFTAETIHLERWQREFIYMKVQGGIFQ